MVPSNLENKIIDELYDLLKELNSVTKLFQSNTTTIAEVRAILDDKISDSLSRQGRLDSNEHIIFHSQTFRTTMKPT